MYYSIPKCHVLLSCKWEIIIITEIKLVNLLLLWPKHHFLYFSTFSMLSKTVTPQTLLICAAEQPTILELITISVHAQLQYIPPYLIGPSKKWDNLRIWIFTPPSQIPVYTHSIWQIKLILIHWKSIYVETLLTVLSPAFLKECVSYSLQI